jgi:hypothetical protein
LKLNYVLIDYENVQVKSLALLKGEQFRVRVFLGPNNKKLPVELVLAMQELGDRAEYIVLETPGVRIKAKDNHARPTIKTYTFQAVTTILGMIFYCRLP